MAHPVEWIMDPLEYEWFYDTDMDAIMVTTTTIVHTYFHLGRIHGLVEPDISPALIVILEAPLAPLLAPWDLSLSPLPNIEMEPISPGLPLV